MRPRAALYLAVTVTALLASATAVFLLVSPRRCTAEPVGVAWQALSVDRALGASEQTGKRVFVEFAASWCPSCKQLDAEVLATELGRELTADMVPVRLDFDDEANRALVERYVVLGLPTTIVLLPDGTQVGRISGYDGRDDWVSKLREAKVASDPLPALREAYRASPASRPARLRLGEALLVRGQGDEGEELLEGLLWTETGEGGEESAEALFLLGRYYHRVKRDPRAARHVWRELATRYPGAKAAEGALWWYAKAQAEIGRPEAGLFPLEARLASRPNDFEAVSEYGEFVARNKLDAHRDAALAAVTRLLASATGDQREELEQIASKLRGE